MNLYDVIKNLLSLKSQWLNLKQANMYSKLTLALTNFLIKQAVEAAFEGVKVANVNTVNVKPKAKRVGRYTGFTSKTKKAIITLAADSKAIELFATEAE